MNWTADDLKDLRRRLGWSKAEMARSLGCKMNEVIRWESGHGMPNTGQCQQMTRFFHQVESYSEQVQRRPVAEQLMQVRGLSQIRDEEVVDCLADSALNGLFFLK